VLESLGRYEESATMDMRALERREATLGMEHPSTILSANNLAFTLMSLKRYDEALVLFDRACSASEKVLGLEHPDTKDYLDNRRSLFEKMKLPESYKL
jgi:tetratricopeptide (TPR) repeat protein